MGSARPKGYMEWDPSPEVAMWVQKARSVLDEYGSYGPMTVRQIFYRLVGQHGYPKDERAYKRLAEYLVKARRAQMVRFDQIRDDGTVTHDRSGQFTRADVWADLLGTISEPDRFVHLNRRGGQPHAIELWCEAGGMAPMLAQMVASRDVSVYSTGGFSSVTVTHEIAQRVLRRRRPTYFLHVGDFDPSGESIFTSMAQDVGAFVIGRHGGSWNAATGETHRLNDDHKCLFIPRRVALTEDQVEQYDLPTAPPKASDSRSVNWTGETTQAEAMPPDLLEEVILAAVDELTDADVLANVEEREERDRERLRNAIDGQSVEDIIREEELENPTLLELFEAVQSRDVNGA